MADTPGWVSNADLAARLSALVDRWNQRENEMIDFISFNGVGDITVHTGDGVAHSLKSFPQLEAEVTALTDSLTGAVAQAQDINSQTVASANAAAASASAAAASETNAAASKTAADGDAAAAASSAASAAADAATATAKAADASASAASASASAAAAAVSKTDADNDAVAAANSAAAAADAATQAQQAAAGKLTYQGVWNVSGGTLPTGASLGYFYLISGGPKTIAGVTYGTGDMIVYGDDAAWHRIDNQQTVASVAGLVGTISVGQLQAALNLATVATSGSYNDLSNKPTLGTAAAKNVGDFATAAQGTKADAALPQTSGAFTGDFNALQTGSSMASIKQADTLANQVNGPGIDSYVTTLTLIPANTGCQIAVGVGANRMSFRGWTSWGGWKAWVEVWTTANLNPASFATAAQGAKADSAVQPAGLSPYAKLSGAAFTGAVSATNLSGTNTGDQDLSGLMPKAGGTFTGTVNITGNMDSVIGNATGGLGAMWCLNTAPTNAGAFMTFHRADAFACYFGIDSDNKLKVGGWSMGAVAYDIHHDGVSKKVFTQSTDPGAAAKDGDLWVW